VTSRDVEVAGLSVRLNESGAGDPILVLHHSTGPLWARFHDELASSYRVIAPDLPGFGSSTRPEDARSPRDLAIYISQLIDVIGLDRVHLLGFGFGGWVAAELATMNQRALRTLTLVGAAGVKPREGFIHDPLLAGWIDYARLGFSQQSTFDELFGSKPAQEIVDLWDYSREMTARLTWKQWMWNWSLPPLLRGIQTPALVVWGSEDVIVPFDCAHQYVELMPNSRLETISGAGHVVELEDPDALSLLIKNFAGPGPKLAPSVAAAAVN
jgi:pimeloyl-ACP methyl ester carboxylesterase